MPYVSQHKTLTLLNIKTELYIVFILNLEGGWAWVVVFGGWGWPSLE